jgi:hypothetical protein
MTDSIRGRRGFDYLVRETAESGNFDFDQVADVHRARILWRA